MAKKEQADFLLRPMGLSDMDSIADWFVNFDDVALFDRGLPIPVGPEFVKESWKSSIEFANPPRALWFMVEDQENEAVGLCGLHSINYIHGDAVLPVFVAQKMRGKGLASALATSMVDIGFDHLRLHRLTTYYRADNAATAHIVKRAGFRIEGCTREGWFAKGLHNDVVQVGLLKSEWLDTRKELEQKLSVAGGISIEVYQDSSASRRE